MADVVCPACGEDMVHEYFAKAFVDVCVNGCGGIWFDRHELQRLDHMTKGKGPRLRAALADARQTDGDRGPIQCVHCSEPMSQCEHEHAKEVTIDECSTCGGIFLGLWRAGPDSRTPAQYRRAPKNETTVRDHS